MKNADSIVGENGCSAEYLMALNNTSKFQDGCIFYAFNDCKSLLLKWFVDLDEDDELTSQQFYNSISRLNEGLKNIKTEFREIGLMKQNLSSWILRIFYFPMQEERSLKLFCQNTPNWIKNRPRITYYY